MTDEALTAELDGQTIQLSRDSLRFLAREVVRQMSEGRALVQLSEKLVNNQQLEYLVREVTLRVVVEQAALDRADLIRSFLGACKARGVTFRMREDGTVLVRGRTRLTPDLLAVWNCYRTRLVAHLEQERDREREAQREYERRKGFLPETQETPPEATVKFPTGRTA